jgi:N-acetylmuramoyl-L-alanine amidase
MQLGHLDPPDTISGIQGRLKALGYYSGPVDGNNSPETEAAVRQFHRAKQMHPTGKASEETSSLLKSLAGH